ncbi:hypothetical protein GGI43DRAFT_88256 [Trichoderma evansii]
MPIPCPSHHSRGARIASVTHLVYPHANRAASARAYKLTCLHTLLFLSHSRSRSLCMCCPFPSLSHPPVSCHPSPFISPPRSSPARLHRILRTSSGRASPVRNRRCGHCKTPTASDTDSAANGAGAAGCPIPEAVLRYMPPLHSHPPVSLLLFCFFPLRRPPEKQPIRAPAQVPAGYSYTHGPSAWMGLGRTLKVAIPPPIRRWA